MILNRMQTRSELIRWPFQLQGTHYELVVYSSGTAALLDRSAYSASGSEFAPEKRLLRAIFARGEEAHSHPVAINFELYYDLREVAREERDPTEAEEAALTRRVVSVCGPALRAAARSPVPAQ